MKQESMIHSQGEKNQYELSVRAPNVKLGIQKL